jgi:hypothetical protein
MPRSRGREEKITGYKDPLPAPAIERPSLSELSAGLLIVCEMLEIPGSSEQARIFASIARESLVLSRSMERKETVVVQLEQ